MRARRVSIVSAAALLLVALSSSSVHTEAAGSPNVLIIVTDDQRFDAMEVMPATRRWLMEGGTTFSRAMATTPLCCPSRASIFTGRYAHNHHVWFNSQAGWNRLDQTDTLQHHLRANGYRTALIGKYLNRWPITEDPPWFDRWSLFVPGENGSSGYYGNTWNLNGRLAEVATYSTDFIADRAESFIRSGEANDGVPWLLYLTPFAPHEPATPADRDADAPVPPFVPNPAVQEDDLSDKPSYVQTSDLTVEQTVRLRNRQLQSLLAVDDMVGRVMRMLQRTNELDRTLVVFTSDNGFFWEEHGLERKGPPYLQGIRVPLILRWSGHMPAGALDRRFAANIDIAPTVMDAAGASIPVGQPIDGRSLLEDWRRPRFLAEYHETQVADAPTWASLRTWRFQYVEFYGPGGGIKFREYYELARDPWQLTNLLFDGSPSNDPDVEPLHLRLKRLRHCEGTTCR